MSDVAPKYNFMNSTDSSVQDLVQQIRNKGHLYIIQTQKYICQEQNGVLFNKVNSLHKYLLRLFKRNFKKYYQIQKKRLDLNKCHQDLIQAQLKKVLDILDSDQSQFQFAKLEDLQKFFKYEVSKSITQSQRKSINIAKYISIKSMKEILQKQSMDYIFKRHKVQDCLAHVAYSIQYQSRLANQMLISRMEFGRCFSLKEMKSYGVSKQRKNKQGEQEFTA